MDGPVGRVVVVEDEPAVRDAVLTGLRQEGFAAMGFADAVDVELILAGAPDLAVLDIAVPGGSGFALARALRARSPLSIIFLTTATELRLLAFLVRHRGQALSKDELLTQVWGYDAYDPNLVEVHLSRLRRKLERAGPWVIETVRGIGCRFAP